MKNKEISFLIFNGFIAVHVKSITKYAYMLLPFDPAISFLGSYSEETVQLYKITYTHSYLL